MGMQGTVSFLYEHSSDRSFKIVQMINTGRFNIYVTPIVNKTLPQLLNSASFANFAYKDDSGDGQFEISNQSASFCSQCAYLIQLTSDSSADGYIMVAQTDRSVSLSLNSIMRDRVSVDGTTNRRYYTFYSITAFNITLSLLYGQVRVVVTDPDEKVVYDQNITQSTTIVVPHNSKTEQFSYEYESIFTQYSISVTAIQNSSYALKASKQSISARIFSNIPALFFFEGNGSKVFQFLNLEGPALENNINFMIDAIYD